MNQTQQPAAEAVEPWSTKETTGQQSTQAIKLVRPVFTHIDIKRTSVKGSALLSATIEFLAPAIPSWRMRYLHWRTNWDDVAV
jgi:hypothetical protein